MYQRSANSHQPDQNTVSWPAGRPQTVTPLGNKARSISTSSFCGTNKALAIVRYPPPCDVTNRSQWVASLRPSPITQHVRQWGVSTEETRQMAIGSTIGI